MQDRNRSEKLQRFTLSEPCALAFHRTGYSDAGTVGVLRWRGQVLEFEGDPLASAQIWARAWAYPGYWEAGVTFTNPQDGGRLTIQRNPETHTVTVSLTGRLTPESARFIGEVLRLLMEQ